MPRKVIRISEEKSRKRKVVKSLIWVFVILLIAAIVAAIIYVVLDVNADVKDNDSEVMLELNGTTGSSNATENVTVSTLPTPEIKSTLKDKLEALESTDIATNLSTVFGNSVDYLKHLSTKWCGFSIVGTAEVDFGNFPKVDACVQEHDLCREVIGFGQTKHGLMNTDVCRRSHCDCDQQFYVCLKSKHELISDIVGFEYFTILGPKCFMEEYPIVTCKKCEYTTLTFKEGNRKRCIEYELRDTDGKKYQWFDNPLYF